MIPEAVCAKKGPMPTQVTLPLLSKLSLDFESYKVSSGIPKFAGLRL